MQKYVEKAAMIAMTVNSVTAKTESESSALAKGC
jgi:Tfp pilus assembly major pilin PilA